jgi:hypothetical protein
MSQPQHLAPDATPEEKDRSWYQTVCQGDRVPQLTVRAVITGGVIGMLMSIANLYTELKIGLSFGVNITACFLAFLVWKFLHEASAGRLQQISILENTSRPPQPRPLDSRPGRLSRPCSPP